MVDDWMRFQNKSLHFLALSFHTRVPHYRSLPL